MSSGRVCRGFLASRMARSPPEGPKPFINTSKGWKGMRKEVIGNATLYLGVLT
jgi:hypothetical protein